MCVCRCLNTGPRYDLLICSPSLLTCCLLCARFLLYVPRSSGPTFAAAASATPSVAPAAAAAVAAVAAPTAAPAVASAATATVEAEPAFDVDALFATLDQF